jgi:hypothetical protein
MLNELQLANYFKTDILPIQDWDGKPFGHSNLKQYGLSFTQRFGMNLMDYKQFGMNGHNGIDIAGIKGTPIVAPCKLWITYTNDSDTGYGINVFGETETQKINGEYYKLEMVFGHFDSIVVKAGKWVNKGELLGYMDSTGYSSGHHLHFGIRPIWSKDGNNWTQMFYNNGYKGYIDPEPFLPHIIWDLSELMQYIDYTNLKHMEGAIIIEGEGVGRKGIVINGILREITKERAAEACLYYLAKKEGKFINTKAFNNMPKGQNF